MPANITLDTQVTFVTDPVSPAAGQEFSVSWQEKNVGDEPSASYQVIFDMDDGTNGDTKEMTVDGLGVDQSALRKMTGWSLPAGNYKMNLTINTHDFYLGNVIIQ